MQWYEDQYAEETVGIQEKTPTRMPQRDTSCTTHQLCIESRTTSPFKRIHRKQTQRRMAHTRVLWYTNFTGGQTPHSHRDRCSDSALLVRQTRHRARLKERERQSDTLSPKSTMPCSLVKESVCRFRIENPALTNSASNSTACFRASGESIANVRVSGILHVPGSSFPQRSAQFTAADN